MEVGGADLLALGDVGDGGNAGNEPVLGMVEHQELGVGQEAVVGLVGERGAVAVLALHRDVILTMLLQWQCHNVHCTWAHAGMSMVPRG